MTTTSDNTLVEMMIQAIFENPDLSISVMKRSKTYATAALQALCTHVGLTVEILEMIRRGDAVVVPTKMAVGNLNNVQYGDWHYDLSRLQLNYPTERREG